MLSLALKTCDVGNNYHKQELTDKHTTYLLITQLHAMKQTSFPFFYCIILCPTASDENVDIKSYCCKLQ